MTIKDGMYYKEKKFFDEGYNKARQEFYLKKQPEAVAKLMKIAREKGIKDERKKILKMFKFELDNQVTSYETLVKLRKLKEK